MTENPNGLSRRTVLKGAAWSVPMVAVATAAPIATASGEPGNGTNYHWAGESQDQWATLQVAAAPTADSTFSVQVIADSPVQNASIVITVIFNPAIVFQSVTTGWATDAEVGTIGNTFVFTQATGGFGHNLDVHFNYSPEDAGQTMTASATMAIDPANAADWTSEVASDSQPIPAG